MKTQLINIDTVSGIKKAERLHNSGKYLQPVPLNEYRNILVFVPRLSLIKQCKGNHTSLNELTNCESCSLLFNK